MGQQIVSHLGERESPALRPASPGSSVTSAGICRSGHPERGYRSPFIPPDTSSAHPRYGSNERGEVWVRQRRLQDRARSPPAPAFEPLRCHTFITESTFGLPIYRWQPQAADLRRRSTPGGEPTRQRAKPAVIFGYALGKAQRVLSGLDPVHRADLHPRRRRTDDRGLSRGRHSPPSHYPVGAAPTATPTGRGPSSSLRLPPGGSGWMRRFGTLLHRVRFGLDAGPRRPAPPGRRSRLCPLRPCRLARAARHHRSDRRRAGLGHPRIHRPSWPAGWRKGLDARAVGHALGRRAGRRRRSRRRT